MFLIDISNTPQQHIHTRLRSHFNQMWHILALTFSFSISVVHSAFGPVYRAAAFYSMEYFMKKIKFLTHTHTSYEEKFESAILIYMISFTCACHANVAEGVDWMLTTYTWYADFSRMLVIWCRAKVSVRLEGGWKFSNFISHNGRC